jgi:hypothetical protein
LSRGPSRRWRCPAKRLLAQPPAPSCPPNRTGSGGAPGSMVTIPYTARAWAPTAPSTSACRTGASTPSHPGAPWIGSSRLVSAAGSSGGFDRDRRRAISVAGMIPSDDGASGAIFSHQPRRHPAMGVRCRRLHHRRPERRSRRQRLRRRPVGGNRPVLADPHGCASVLDRRVLGPSRRPAPTAMWSFLPSRRAKASR